jgi:fibronectin type 3 domain-containing protein
VCILIVSCFLVGCGFKTTPRPATATVPGDIGLIDAHAYPNRIVLKWSVPPSNVEGSALQDLSGFKVYRFDQPEGEECENCEEKKTFHSNVDFQNPTNAVISGGEVAYTDKDVSAGHMYSYWVSAYNLRGREGRLSQIVPVVFGEPPPPPEHLRAGPDAEGIVLEWDAPAQEEGIRGYRIYRGTTDNIEEMKLKGGVRSEESSFVDKDVEKDKPYYYQVRSFKMNKGISEESRPSATAKAVLPAVQLQPPENVLTIAIRRGIKISWTPVKIERAETRYNVFRSEAQKVFEKINAEPLINPTYFDSTVKKGKKYRYAVTAFPKDKPEYESRRSGSEAVTVTR